MADTDTNPSEQRTEIVPEENLATEQLDEVAGGAMETFKAPELD